MRRTAHLLFASTLFLAACGPSAAPAAPTSPPAPAAKPTEAPKPAAQATTAPAAPTAAPAAKPTTAAAPAPTTAAAKPAAAGGRGRGDVLKILYWQAPTILNSHLAQGTKDY